MQVPARASEGQSESLLEPHPQGVWEVQSFPNYRFCHEGSYPRRRLQQKVGGSDSKLFKNSVLNGQDASQPHLPLRSMRVLVENKDCRGWAEPGPGEGRGEADTDSRIPRICVNV